MSSFPKKWALITGSTSGIGFEFSQILARDYNLILVGRDPLKLKNTKEQLLANPCLDKDLRIETICSDLKDTQSAEFIFNECQAGAWEVDVLINNAGFGIFGEHIHLNDNEILNMLNTNIIALTFLCKYFANPMKQRRSGFILNVASVAAYQPVPGLSSYAASKSYVLNFSEALSKELEDYNVSVTCLSPGSTRTNFFKLAGIGDKDSGFFKVKTRMSPEKVAQIGLKALFQKNISVIPGWKNNLFANMSRFAPRFLVAKISKFMTKKL